MAKTYKAVIKEEKLGRSSQVSESKQVKNTLCKVIESCANYHQTSRDVMLLSSLEQNNCSVLEKIARLHDIKQNEKHPLIQQRCIYRT